jgi:hypothetical protein
VSNLYGVRGLKADLTARGILNKNNVPFTPSNLTRILANEMYAGTKWAFKRYDKTVGPRKKKKIIRDESEWIPVTVPAIVSKELWQQAQDVKKRNTIMSMKATKYDYLLRNIAKCGACGYSLNAVHLVNKGKDYFYYACTAQSNEIKCPNRKHLPSEKVDTVVWNKIVTMAKGSKKLSFAKPQNNDVQRKQIEKHLIKLKEKQTAMLKWVSAGTITINDAEVELQNISKEISASKIVLSGITETKKPTPLPVQDILTAVTFMDKRKVILDMGIKIHAEKVDGKIKIDFSL